MGNSTTPTSDLSAIRAIVLDYGSRIGAPDTALFDRPQGDGSPYLEVSEAYHYVVEERGVELRRRTTDDLDELLYWVFDDITFSMSAAAELRNRRPGEDPRHQLFDRQEALLGQLSAAWAERKSEEHRDILVRHPFNDASG